MASLLEELPHIAQHTFPERKTTMTPVITSITDNARQLHAQGPRIFEQINLLADLGNLSDQRVGNLLRYMTSRALNYAGKQKLMITSYTFAMIGGVLYVETFFSQRNQNGDHTAMMEKIVGMTPLIPFKTTYVIEEAVPLPEPEPVTT